MKPFFRSRPILRCILAGFLIAFLPLCQAESAAHMQKHARKVEKQLARYRAGTYLQVELRNHTQSLGSLGALSASSFALTNADTNTTQSYRYVDVVRVEKGEELIGAGSVHRRHLHLLIPAIAVVAAAGAAAAVLATR